MEEGLQLDGGFDQIANRLMIDVKGGDVTLPRNELTPNIIRLHEPKHCLRPLLNGSYLPEFIDFKTVNNWIRDCELNHEDSCGLSTDYDCPHLDSNFVVIDVNKIQTSKLSQMRSLCNHRDTRYVTLSYVWEQGSSPLRHRGVRPSPQVLSQTIADAVEVCKRLGERYLWVDALCISKDRKERKAQISQMDSIYNHAAFAIIAALDRTSLPGLPGVRSGRKQKAQRDGRSWFVGIY